MIALYEITTVVIRFQNNLHYNDVTPIGSRHIHVNVCHSAVYYTKERIAK